jgi:hypothetical protein
MLHTVIIVFKCTARVERRIDVNALDLSSELLLEGFERKEVVAENEAAIEKVVIGYALHRVIGLLRILKQDARLQPGPALLPNPRQFQLLL